MRFMFLLMAAAILVLASVGVIIFGFRMFQPESDYGELGRVLGPVILYFGFIGIVLGATAIVLGTIGEESQTQNEQLSKLLALMSAANRPHPVPSGSSVDTVAPSASKPMDAAAPVIHEPEPSLGKPALRTCAACGTPADAAARFCDKCGQRLV